VAGESRFEGGGGDVVWCESLEVGYAVGLGALEEEGEVVRELRVGGCDDEFSRSGVGDVAVGAVGVEGVAAGEAEVGFEGVWGVVDSGVDYF